MSAATIHASAECLALMGNAAVRSVLLACFLAVVLTAFRVRSVRAQLLALRGMLLVALAMPLLLWLGPAVPLSVPLPQLRVPSRAAGHVGAARRDSAPTALSGRTTAGDPLARGRNSRPSAGQSAVASPVRDRAPPTGFARRSMPWPMLAMALYLAVTLMFVLRLVVGHFVSKRLALAAVPIEEAGALGVLSGLCRAARRPAPVRLAESDALSVPVTYGLRDPVILFPSTWRDWDADTLAAVLAHEVSHAARHDGLVRCGALIHRAVFWFSPLSWWLEHRIAELSEQASDEAALAGGADRARYAETLLGFLADLEASPGRVRWQGISMVKPGQDEKRIERILAWRSTMSNKLTKSLIAALVALCAPAVVLTACVHPSVRLSQAQAAPAERAVPAPSAPPTASAPAPAQPRQPTSSSTAPGPGAQAPAASAAPAAPAPSPPWADFGNDFNAYWNALNAYLGRFAPPYGPYWAWGPRFVIVTKGSDHLIMAGSEADAEHARSLRAKIPGDFIWFERDGKSYIIRDQATIDRAKAIWRSRKHLEASQQALQEKQRQLGAKMRQLAQQRARESRVKIPDMSAQLQKLQSELKDVNAKGATPQQLGDLQREVGELQRTLAEAGWSSEWRSINRRTAEIGRQMGALGRQIGDMARQRVERVFKVSRDMQQLLDDAIARGLAKPESSGSSGALQKSRA